MRKIVLSISIPIILIATYISSCIYKLYIPGYLSSPETVHIKNITLNNDDITVELSSIDSSLVFKPYTKKITDNTMIIRLYKGYRINESELSEKYIINENITGIDTIILSDNQRKKIIWTR